MGINEAQHRYSAREVRAILRRVAELGRSQDALDATAGPTLDQLQVAASELGLDPALIEQAAREVASDHREGLLAGVLGGPWRADCSGVVDGALDEADWPLLLDEVRASTGCAGEPKPVGNSFGWVNGAGPTDSLHITATPDADRTRVRVTARWDGLGSLMLGAPPIFGLLLGGIASGLLMEGVRGVPVWVGLCVLFGPPLAALVVGRIVVGRLSRRRRRSVTAVAQVVQGWIARRCRPAAASAPTLGTASTASETGVIEVSAGGEVPGPRP